MAKKIEQWEITRYWEIFSELLPPNAPQPPRLSGDQAASVLKNSRLRDDQLERVWDIADIDNDGQLDFEEFCVAMRLIFDQVNGESADIPRQLPDWLVPESKAHLVQAGRAVTTGHVRAADVRSAWNLVNPAADEVIGKDAALAFLHVLSGRHDRFRLPRSVPASLRASFERKGIEYNVDRVRADAARSMADDSTATGRKSKFGDSYLSRLGKGSERPRGTDFSSVGTTEDWEEVRLKKQLRELEAKMERIEQNANKKGRRDDSKPALVKRELEQLLDYKRRELRDLELGEGKAKEGQGLRGVEEEISTVREQLDGLEQHFSKRDEVLKSLKAEIEQERRS
ncbi:hypothetical protein FH972_021359 [Carpinus fangiana]|uniref:Endocytosis protein 3 n=1 Tax=Carpinus fangiana TaxID=176857 RepID=A0A5N6KPQ9_9ROSI|nr:hypothetical protein FH972_021359 [Carpinus fangiana]